MHKSCSVLSILVLFAIIFSCKQKDSQIQEVQELPADFIDFHTKFHIDSVFQKQHIIFPLEGAEPTQGSSPDFYWSKENWNVHVPFNRSIENFKQKFAVFGTMVIEYIQEDSGHLMIEKRYNKSQGEWFLIYYSVQMNVF